MDDEPLIRELVEDIIKHSFPEVSERVKSFASRREVGEFIHNNVIKGNDCIDLLVTDNNIINEGPDMGWQLVDLIFGSSQPGLQNTQILIMSGGQEENLFISLACKKEREFPQRFSFVLKPNIGKKVVEAVKKVYSSVAV
jgi:hypothetical protein